MKRSILFILSLLICVGCTTDLEETNIPENAKKSVGSVVPVEEALGELTAVMGAISSETRSCAAFDYTKSIQKITVSGGSPTTRSEESNLPDTMVYVVNFTDNKGFAVLGAQRSLEPVYAITESGSFDANKLNAAIAEAQKRSLAGEEAPATRTESEPEAIQQIGTDFAYILLAEALVAAPRISADTLSVTYGPWVTNGTIGPLVEVKWDQTYPFNMSMPTTPISLPSGLTFNFLHPVGCGIVAAAQVMSCVRRPILAPAGSTNYNWTTLKTISNYTNWALFVQGEYPNNVETTAQTYTKQLADVLYYLSICFNAQLDVQKGTGVSDRDVVAGLKQLDPTYFANAKAAFLWITSWDTIYNDLNNNKPMYVSGQSGSSGHAWVIDGYLNRSRPVAMQLRYGYTGPIIIQNTTEQSKLIHINWGYRGQCDGYFAENVFHMQKRISQDNIIDTNPAPNGQTNYSGNKIILY